MSEQAIARIGDSCQLFCNAKGHGSVTGTFFEGHPLAEDEEGSGKYWVLIGHRGTASCGHTFQAITGSSISSINDIPVVRVTDQVEFIDSTGTGVVVSGSPISFTE